MSDIGKWTTTAGGNTAAPPDGYPSSGMFPSQVDNAGREQMAAVRRWYEDAEWLDYQSSPALIDETTFTVVGDHRHHYTVDRPVRFWLGTNRHFGTVVESSYDAGSDRTRVEITAEQPLDGLLQRVDVHIVSHEPILRVQSGDGFPSGTCMIFYQPEPPPGWSKVADVDDVMVRITSGQGGEGKEGGSWSIAGITTAPHTLTVEQIPAHKHYTVADAMVNRNENVLSDYKDFPVARQGTVSDGDHNYALAAELQENATHGITSETGGGQPHTHAVTADDTWRPKYISCILCRKD